VPLSVAVSAAHTVRIARKCVESTDKLGRHRWVIERTLTGYRRLTLRYERTPTTSAPSSPSQRAVPIC
jgi:hypothetical protein